MQLEPFPYHLAIAGRLERAEPGLWRWFQSEHMGDRYRELTRADLQRRAIRLERDGAHETHYTLADIARDRLGVAAPVHLYRLEEAAPSSAAFLVLLPDEMPIILGDMLDLLDSEAEWLAAVGREIARFRLYQAREGRVHIAACLLRWLARQTGCPAELIETAHRFRLMTEAYCDLGGFHACDNRAAAVRILFKASQNAGTEDAEAYLKLADGTGEADGSTDRTAGQPELAARAIALARATAQSTLDPAAMAESLIANPIDLGSLDLLDQETLHTLTRAVLDRVLSEPAGGTLRVLDHAREMFPDYTPNPLAKPLERPAQALAANAIDYLVYLLLDLATVEGTRLREAIAVAAAAADELEIGPRFREIARQELRGRRGLQAGLARRAA